MKKMLKKLFPKASPTHGRAAGFTLIELLVVVAILGALAAVAVPAVAQFANRGKTESRKAELVNVQTAVDAYIADNQVGPTVDGTAATTVSQNNFALFKSLGTDGLFTGTVLYPKYIRNAYSITYDSAGAHIANADYIGYCVDVNSKVTQKIGTAALLNCP